MTVHRGTRVLIICGALWFAGCDPEPTAGGDASAALDATTALDGSASDGGAGDDGGARADGAASDAPSRLESPDECATPRAGWVFCEDFQSGNKDRWDDYDGNPDETNLILSDPGPAALEGNLAMRLRVPAGRGGADLVKVLPPGHDRLYARWYIRYEAGFDFTAANHGGGLHAGSRDHLGSSDDRPSGDDFFSAGVDYLDEPPHIFDLYAYYRGMYQDCADPSGSCWGDHFPCVFDEGSTYCTEPAHRETVLPPLLETERWYCVELMMDAGAPRSSASGADGALDLWVDGAEIGPWDDLWLRTSPDVQPSVLWLQLFHHGEHSEAGVLYDHIVVSTERIGCL